MVSLVILFLAFSSAFNLYLYLIHLLCPKFSVLSSENTLFFKLMSRRSFQISSPQIKQAPSYRFISVKPRRLLNLQPQSSFVPVFLCILFGNMSNDLTRVCASLDAMIDQRITFAFLSIFPEVCRAVHRVFSALLPQSRQRGHCIPLPVCPQSLPPLVFLPLSG